VTRKAVLFPYVRTECDVCFRRVKCLRHGRQILCAACLDALYPKDGAA
jgi:hypothetical protein